jgi:hypothetical protein
MNAVRLTKLNPWQYQALRWAAISVIVTLTLLPAVRIANILATTGANNLSSDDGNFINKFLGQVLEGTYHWQNFPRDTFFNTHSLLLPGLVYLGLAYFANFNVYVALYLGLLLAALKLLLIHSALTKSDQGGKRWERWLLWPLLAALVFSVSHISSYEHALTAIAGGLSQLAFALGVWGLIRFPGKWRGVVLMAIGGVVATLSSGAGLVMWPSFLLGLILLGFRKVGHYAFWLSAATLSVLPYVFFLFLDPQQNTRQHSTLLSTFNYLFVIDTLGRPFVNGIGLNYSRMPISVWIGSLGIALFVVILILLILLDRERRTLTLAQSAPALMLIAFSLLTIWQISLFRDQIAPWYTTLSIAFWIGLVGLTYVLWVNHAIRPAQGRQRHWATPLIARLLGAVVVGGLACLYVSSNFSYTDKTLLLRTRAPSSAACLRNYRTAPTYCEETLVIWQLGDPHYIERLAQPLERNHLSVFAPRQQWTLQGDFILDSVKIFETPGIADIRWSADLTATPVAWRDYRHLNLFLHTPNAISWTVSLPPNVEQADFHSAIAISQTAPFDPVADGVRFEVYLKREGGVEESIFSQYLAPEQRQWQPFTIPLSAYAGQMVTLRLTSSAGGNVIQDWAMYRYPYIDLLLNPAKDVDTAVSSKPFIPTLTDADARLDTTDSNLWQTSNMQPTTTAGATDTWTIGQIPNMEYDRPLDLCLADYTHFYARLAAQGGFPIALKISYKLKDAPVFVQRVTIPLFSDGEMHEYTYDLKLLELNQQARLTGIRLSPFRPIAFTGESWVKISDFRLIRGSNPSCQGPQVQPQLVDGSAGGKSRQMATVVDLIGLANSPQAHKQPEDPVKNAPLVSVSTFTIEGDARRVLYMHPTSSVIYTLRLPIHAHLQTSLALDPQTWQPGNGDGVEYIVYLKAADGRSHTLFDRYIDPKNIPDDRKWHDLSIDLSAYGGQEITLTLTTLPGPKGDATYDWSGWANPQIVVFQLEDSSSKPRSKKLAR